MKRYHLTIELNDDIIFSARSATLGGHSSLDYIPGAALLGASASKIYRQLGSQAFTVFHSGQVRFGNAYPLSNTDPESIAYPMPFAWHIAKGSEHYQAHDHRLLNGEAIYNNLTTQTIPVDKQPKQLRDQYITEQGYCLKPSTTLRMKTAINQRTGVAARAQLFGYQAIEAGQCFQAILDFDESVDSATMEMVVNSLQGKLKLGRSRSAQYGRVECCLSEVAIPEFQSPTGKKLVLWLTSDLLLYNQHGMPELNPSPELLELGQGQLLKNESWLRFRQYSPYNGKRRAYDQVRQVIQQGSVLTLEFEKDIERDILTRIQSGLGAGREIGLGQCQINSPLLLELPPNPEHYPVVQSSLPDRPQQIALLDWLDDRVKNSDTKRDDRIEAERLAARLTELYDSARRYAGQPKGIVIGPGKTQWGLIAEAGKRHGIHRQELENELKAICRLDNESKTEDEDWSVSTGDSDQSATFGKWLLQQINSDSTMQNPGYVIANLARMASSVVSEQEVTK